MNISIRNILVLCSVKLALTIPVSGDVVFNPDFQPVFFEIAPGVESVISKTYTSPQKRDVAPHLILGRFIQDGRQANRPGGRKPHFSPMVGEMGSGDGSSDERKGFVINTSALELIEGSGGSGAGSGNFDVGIVFPNDPKVVSSTTISSTSLGSVTGAGGSSSDNCVISNGLIKYRESCHSLLKQGPCVGGEWLIINKKGLPQCATRPCPSGQLLYKKKCVNTANFSVCGRYEILYVDFSANVYCDCQPEFVYDADARRCYAEYDRGSCSFGEYLEVDSKGEVHCVTNPCITEDLIQDPETKKCFKKLFKGGCPKGVSSLVTKKNGTAECYALQTRNIFEVPALTSCPPGSKKDYFGNCRTLFRVNSNEPSSYRVPSQYTSRYSACPPNYTKFPDGTCKKVNNIFER